MKSTPQVADVANHPLNGPTAVAEGVGDLVIRQPFQFPDRDLLQFLVLERIEKVAAGLGHREFDLRVGHLGGQLIEGDIAAVVARPFVGGVAAAPTLARTFHFQPIGETPFGIQSEKAPELEAIGGVFEPIRADRANDAIETAQRNIFFVEGGTDASESSAGDANDSLEVAIPKPSGCVVVSALHLAKPTCD